MASGAWARAGSSGFQGRAASHTFESVLAAACFLLSLLENSTQKPQTRKPNKSRRLKSDGSGIASSQVGAIAPAHTALSHTVPSLKAVAADDITKGILR